MPSLLSHSLVPLDENLRSRRTQQFHMCILTHNIGSKKVRVGSSMRMLPQMARKSRLRDDFVGGSGVGGEVANLEEDGRI